MLYPCLGGQGSLFFRELRDYQLFTTLLEMVPGLEDSIKDGGWEEIATMVCDSVHATPNFFFFSR